MRIFDVEQLIQFSSQCQEVKSFDRVYRNLFRILPRLADVPGDFLEVGSFRGKTSVFLARFLERWPERKLITIDSHTQSHYDEAYKMNLDAREVFSSFIECMSGLVNHQHIPMDSSEACHHVEDSSIAFAFIDGDHSEEGVLKDFAAYIPKMVTGGIIAFDDYRNGRWKGVRRALQKVAYGNPGLELVYEGEREVYFLVK